MSDQTMSDNFVARLFFGIFNGCLTGIIAGMISVVIGSLIYWKISEMSFQQLTILHIDPIELINQDVVTTGVPLGVLIGIMTGIGLAAFKLPRSKSLVWAVFTCLASVSAAWLSGLNHWDPIILQRAFDLEVGIVGLTSGWATHRYTMRQRDNTSEPFSRGFVVFSYVLVLLLIFTMSLHYFAFLNALRNVPS